jgi:hypothetical protein
MYSNEKRRWLLINKRNKGQVTIFIIIAIIIVGLAVLFLFIIPESDITTVFDEKNPNAFIQTCLEDKIIDTIEIVSLQGGSLEPEHYIIHQEETVEYLCYTNEYHLGCVIQQPLLKQHIESEIEDEIKGDVVNCFKALEESYTEKNYNVDLEPGITNVELLPKRVVASFDYVLTVSRAQTDRYDSFSVVLNNNLYELVGITNSILELETEHVEAETTLYMNYYHDLKVEKLKKSDGSTVYILTDGNNEKKFQFAVRSGVLPSGYRTS